MLRSFHFVVALVNLCVRKRGYNSKINRMCGFVCAEYVCLWVSACSRGGDRLHKTHRIQRKG